MEFPSNAYPWMALEARGIECRLAKNRDGRVTRRRSRGAESTRGRASSPSPGSPSTTAGSIPSRRSARFCRARGILFVVDGIQGLGQLPIDVRRAGVDVLAADAHKWLYGLEGGAIFYVAESAREKVPAAASPAGGTSGPARATSTTGSSCWPGARRYEPGTLPTAQPRGLVGGARPAPGDGGRDRAREESSRRPPRCATASRPAAGGARRRTRSPPESRRRAALRRRPGHGEGARGARRHRLAARGGRALLAARGKRRLGSRAGAGDRRRDRRGPPSAPFSLDEKSDASRLASS